MKSGFSKEEKYGLACMVEKGIVLSAERMEKLTRMPWHVLASSIDETSVEGTYSSVKDEPALHIGIHLRSLTTMPMQVLLVFPEWSVDSVTEAVTRGFSEKTDKLRDRNALVLAELGNILAHGLITALADGLNISLILSPPEVRREPQGKLFDMMMSAADTDREALIVSRFELASENLTAGFSMYLLLDTGLLRPLLQGAAARLAE